MATSPKNDPSPVAPGASSTTPTSQTVQVAPNTMVAPDSGDDRQDKIDRRECVVDADMHVGRAVPGSKVCSYHTMHYDNDGNRRAQ